MDMIDEIYEKACALTRGALSDGDGALLKEMCGAARDELLHRLRGGVDLEDIHAQFVRAAASLGLSLYAGLETTQGSGGFSAGSFAAGSVRVSRRSGKESRESAAALRKQAELMLSGLISDDGFSFRAVDG